MSGNSSASNGNKKSPNCPSSGGSYLEVKKVFQNLGLSPTKFLDSPIKSNKNIDKLTSLKSFTCPASTKEGHRRDKGRDVPISKTRLTYGMEIDDRESKNNLDAPSTNSINNPLKSNTRDTESNKTNTKEIYDTTRPRQIVTTNRSNSSSNVTLSGNTRVKISANHYSKPRDTCNSLAAVDRKMDKSSNTGSSSGSSTQNPSAGEKRPLSSVNPSQEQHLDDNDDETKRKKQKISSAGGSTSSGKDGPGKDDTNAGKDSSNLSGSSSSASTIGSAGNGSSSGKVGRSTRGSSSEKTTGTNCSFRKLT